MNVYSNGDSAQLSLADQVSLVREESEVNCFRLHHIAAVLFLFVFFLPLAG